MGFVYFLRLRALFFDMERDKRKVTERKTLLFGLNNNTNNKKGVNHEFNS